MSFWRKGKDSLKNGAVMGALVAAAVVWGNQVYSWLLINIPAVFTSTIPLWAYILIIGGAIGYYVDKY